MSFFEPVVREYLSGDASSVVSCIGSPGRLSRILMLQRISLILSPSGMISAFLSQSSGAGLWGSAASCFIPASDVRR